MRLTLAEAEQRDRAQRAAIGLRPEQLDRMGEAQILELARGMGPSVIGQAHFDRAAEIRVRTGDGMLGPALTDPNFAKKEAEKVAARRAAREAAKRANADEAELEVDDEPASDVDPWSFITPSGVKALAREHGVSYHPKVKKEDLVEQLRLAGVKPPAPPARPATEDDFNDLE